MSESDQSFVGGVFLGAVFSSFVVGCTTDMIVRDSWHADSVKRGYAEYNSKTGVWQWKEPLPKPEECK